MSKKIILFLLVVFINTTLFGQKRFFDYNTNPKEYEIAGITITGMKFYSYDLLIQAAGLKVGDKIVVPGDHVNQATEKLWKQGLFSEVQINASKIEGSKIYLNIQLKEKPKLSEIVYKGIKKGEREDITELLKLVRGSHVTENTIITTKNLIKKHYEEKGYFKTQINVYAKTDTALQNTVKLYIEIQKNKRTRIKDIVIEGNQFLTANQVRRAMKETKKRRWWAIFSSSKFIRKNYEEDKNLIIAKYNEEGFRDAKIEKDSIFDYDHKDLKIIIKIHEGHKYYFRNISWVGNSVYSSTELTHVLGIKKGDIFDQKRLDQRLTTDETAVGNLYMDNGYLFYNLTPRELTVENDSIDLEMIIFEGKPATFRNIIITGNNRTNEHVIRRELRTIPGELFRKSDVIRSIRELAQLGNFDPEKILPQPYPIPEESAVDIEYSLVEKGNDQIELSGGWGAGMLVGTIGLSFNNFSLGSIFEKEAWHPLPSGDGQRLSIRAQTNGSRYQSYNMSFVEPWLGGKKPNSFTFSIYHTKQTNGYDSDNQYYQAMKVTGVAVGLGTRLKWPDDYFSLYNEISFQNYSLNNWNFVGALSNGQSNNISYKIALTRSSIDAPVYTRTGSTFTLALQFTPPFSLWNGKNYKTIAADEKYKWIEYHKWTFTGDWFNRLIGNDFVLHAKTQFGFLGYFNKDLGHSPFEGFTLGGDGMGYYTYGRDVIGLRGYENDALTPYNGGNMYDKFQLELRYPVTLSESAQIYVLSFAEAGNCWNSFNQFNPFKMYRSAGFGVRILLPMLGMLGIDWGYGFDNIPGRSGGNKSQFHFVLGQQF